MDGSEVIFGFLPISEQYREVPEKPLRCVHVSRKLPITPASTLAAEQWMLLLLPVLAPGDEANGQ
jgi:hypothetical protein